MKYFAIIGYILLALGIVIAAPIHTTYLWHLEQPIYWPGASPYGQGYQTAWESILQRNAGAFHPQNNVAEIFSIADRVAAYQTRPRESIQTMSGADAGAQVTYTGGLVRNVASLGAVSQLGYGPNWNSNFIQGRALQTSGGRPRMEMVVIPYHHALAPLVDKAVLKKEIQIYQYLYPWVWGTTPAPSTGFFPPELAFSERILPVLAECGITWSFVPSNHLSRAVSNFPLVLGTGGENCNPPNRADQINPASANWFSMTISRGCTSTDAVPFSYQLHYAEAIDPETGEASRVIVVPVAMGMSWQDGYQSYGVGDINSIAADNDPAHPMLITLGHDGDNAFGGGYSYYMESVPSFTAQAVNAGYEPTTVPEFIADHPPQAGDVVHLEDGAWVNADGDFGDPDFVNWNWPPYNAAGQTDIINGWALDDRNWAVITAATNRVVTAEAIAGPANLAAIQDPRTNAANPIDLAWHFLLGSLNSGYMYYGSSLDMEVKQTVACNAAMSYCDPILQGGADLTPPTIWAVQQFPHNPGATGFGSAYGYRSTAEPRDPVIWSFIYDVSGIQTATLKYRLDLDGENPIASRQNETFGGGSEVSAWRSRTMTRRAFPAGNIYNDAEILFDTMPQYIADQYYYHLNDGEMADSGGVLVDYYIEAVDSLGNAGYSDIYHTYVGTGSGSSGGSRVMWQPTAPIGGDTMTVFYSMTGSPLPANTNPVYIHIGFSGWQGIITPDPAMSYDSLLARWKYSCEIPVTATSVDVVFRDNANHWDNNDGADWHIPVIAGSSGFVMDGALDTTAQLLGTDGTMHLWADWNGSDLYLATDRARGSSQDRFLFLASPPGAMTAAPWAKNGQVALWASYLAEEADNGWSGWFDANGSTTIATGSILEGTIHLVNEFSMIPEAVRICAGRYQSPNGGSLAGQVPAAVVPGNDIEFAEWARLSLQPDSLTMYSVGTGIQLKWTEVLGAVGYTVYRAPSLDGPWTNGGQITAPPLNLNIANEREYFRVTARY
jgi:hypothetical protein